MPNTELPEFREWSIAAVRLLQGVVYADDGARLGDSFSRRGPQLADYFARLGLLLVVDEPEGLAYLRQLRDDELPDGYDRLPKLFRRTRLGYDETLLCVLLRDSPSPVRGGRPAQRALHGRTDNPVRAVEKPFRSAARRGAGPPRTASALGKLEDLGFVRKVGRRTSDVGNPPHPESPPASGRTRKPQGQAARGGRPADRPGESGESDG